MDQDTTFVYAWIRTDGDTDTYIDGATSSSYTPTSYDEGKTIKVMVFFRTTTRERVRLFSAPTEVVVAVRLNSPATGAPTISGAAQVGATLTADTSGIDDTDGLDNVSFTYQWIADDADIAGATDSTYTLVADDEGKTVKVRVSFTDDAGNDETLTTATVAVAPLPNTPATGTPSISGTAQVGETLTVDTSGIADEDGLTNVSYSYQWERNDGTTDTEIQDATGSTYSLVSDDEAKTVKVRVSFTDDAGNEEMLTSAATAEVAARSNSPATGLPTINGRAHVGETLTADTSGVADEDGLDNASFAYQWLADDADIAGATSSSYTLDAGDEGKTIRVTVTFTDHAGKEESLTSAATAAVVATVPGVPRSIEAERGGTGELDVSWEEPDSNGGSAITGYTVQWKESSDSWDSAADVSETTVTGTSHTISRLSLGTEYTVRVIATNSVGDGSASAEASATADAQISQQQVATQNTPATGAPTIGGTPEVGQTLSADTSDISDTDGLANAVFTYQWIRTDGTTDTDISGATGSTYALVTDDEDKTVKVRVSFTDDTGNDETLTSTATTAVEAALTVELQGVPDSHNGSGPFTFRILFSESVNVGYVALKEHSFQVSNATIERAQRVNGRNDLRKFTVQPSSDAAVTLVLPTTEDCATEGAICTSDGKRLSTRLEITVPGPAPANSVSHGCSDHQRDVGSGANAHRVHIGHQRCRRAEQCVLQLPVGCQRWNGGHGHPRGDCFNLHSVRRRRGKEHQDSGVLHRRRRQR